jgi:hypothetical protein
MKIAIVITGDVRDCPIKDKIKDIFSDCDVFCGSYSKHEDYISNIGKNNYSNLINEATEIRLPSLITKKNMQGNMLQWLHLDNVIQKFEKQLLTYDVIFKYRFDYDRSSPTKDENFLDKISVEPNTLFHDYDRVFYSDNLTFIKTFKGFYDNLTNYTFQPNRDINDDSFRSSWMSDPALKMHLKTIGVFSSPLQFRSGWTPRGSHKKEHADGNKRLYSDDDTFSSDKYWS